jgi:hypothetical protein
MQWLRRRGAYFWFVRNCRAAEGNWKTKGIASIFPAADRGKPVDVRTNTISWVVRVRFLSAEGQPPVRFWHRPVPKRHSTHSSSLLTGFRARTFSPKFLASFLRTRAVDPGMNIAKFMADNDTSHQKGGNHAQDHLNLDPRAETSGGFDIRSTFSELATCVGGSHSSMCLPVMGSGGKAR